MAQADGRLASTGWTSPTRSFPDGQGPTRLTPTWMQGPGDGRQPSGRQTHLSAPLPVAQGWHRRRDGRRGIDSSGRARGRPTTSPTSRRPPPPGRTWASAPMAIQAASAASTGGSITGITDLAVDGGTGASTGRWRSLFVPGARRRTGAVGRGWEARSETIRGPGGTVHVPAQPLGCVRWPTWPVRSVCSPSRSRRRYRSGVGEAQTTDHSDPIDQCGAAAAE